MAHSGVVEGGTVERAESADGEVATIRRNGASPGVVSRLRAVVSAHLRRCDERPSPVTSSFGWATEPRQSRCPP